MADWTEKYRPSTLSEVRGNDKARDAFADWARSWDDHHEAVVLHGSPGVGKTSAAHALANDMGWETVELNASDQRTADVIERFAGRAARNATLGGSAAGGGAAGGDTASRQLVILDEADNIHGNYDRGARAQSRSWSRSRVSPSSSSPTTTTTWRAGSGTPHRRSSSAMSPRAPSSPSSATSVARRGSSSSRTRSNGSRSETVATSVARSTTCRPPRRGRDSIAVEDVVTGDRDKALGLFPYLDAVLKGIGGGGASVGVRRRRDARRPDEVDREQRLGRVRPERGGARVRLPRERRRAGARPGHPELLVLALRHRQRGRGRRRRPRRDQGRVDALRPPAVLEPLPTRPRTRWSGRSLPRAGAASQPRVARCSRFWRRSPTTASPAS